jgi:hypothetical protein
MRRLGPRHRSCNSAGAATAANALHRTKEEDPLLLEPFYTMASTQSRIEPTDSVNAANGHAAGRSAVRCRLLAIVAPAPAASSSTTTSSSSSTALGPQPRSENSECVLDQSLILLDHTSRDGNEQSKMFRKNCLCPFPSWRKMSRRRRRSARPTTDRLATQVCSRLLFSDDADLRQDADGQDDHPRG